MLGLKRNVGIQIANDVEFKVFEPVVASNEGIDFSSKVPLGALQAFAAIRSMDCLAVYLFMISSVPSVEPSLTITHPQRQELLRNHGLQRQLDKPSFVPGQGNNQHNLGVSAMAKGAKGEASRQE